MRRVVALLKAAFGKTVEKAVFWDEDFTTGEDWFHQLHDEVDRSLQLFVFWCFHSAESPAVRQELLYAIEHKKRVVPVLLDDTVLAPELASIQGIDLRESVFHQKPQGFNAIGEAPGGVEIPGHVLSSEAVTDAHGWY